MDEFERWWEAYDDPHGHGRPHKEAARIGYEAGLRRAAEVAKRGDITGWVMDGGIRDAFADAILAEIK